MLKSQQCADIVFKNVALIAAEEGENPKRYKSLCKRAGGLFRTVGLVQFATFITAKGRKEPYYAWLSDHLQRELKAIESLQSVDSDDFLEKIRRLPLPEYMNVSRAVLQLLLWHKRVSEILIEGTADTGGDE